MTTPLQKPVRRVVAIAGSSWIVEMSRAGVMFRPAGRRHRLVAPWSLLLKCAERLAGEELHREQLRDRTMRRLARERAR